MFYYTSLVQIPAYDAEKNGLIIELELKASLQNQLQINTYGAVAQALQRNFKRVIEIMSSMKKSWACLQFIHYEIECKSAPFRVRNAKSSSMALSIALINMLRSLQGNPPVLGLCGTGILRIDGSFDHAHLEEKKYGAAKMHQTINTFITPKQSRHLFELEEYINHL